MSDDRSKPAVTRREALGVMSKAAVASIALPPFLHAVQGGASVERQATLAAVAGPDRVAVLPGRTYINAWAGYGERPRRVRRRRGEPEPQAAPTGPASTVEWSKESGAGDVTFADAHALVTTATFSAVGSYVLRLTAKTQEERVTSTFRVMVEAPPPAQPLDAVPTRRYRINSRLWNWRAKSLITKWIPHCIAQLNRTDLELGQGGLDNFIEAAKALRGEPHGPHKGYVFSNAYVFNAVEAMCLAGTVDPQGDPEIVAAHGKVPEVLNEWIPKILAAQEPDGYLQTAFTLRDPARWPARWSAQGRANHEGYVAGYFLEAAVAHCRVTDGKDRRLYDAAKKLANCWYDHIGPPPKQEWFDGHQAMEQALFRFGELVDEVEGDGAGRRYRELGKFLLDCRRDGFEYDQSHLPVVQQYEAEGHAVRAAYNYSGMADVALATRNPDYLSAVRSLWDNIVNKKYYVTGGIGSGETSEGFGPNYSLRNNAYCESCSSCGEISFQAKLNRLYHDARYADLYEQTLYNALLGSVDLAGGHFYYTNPLDANAPRTAWHNVPCCTGNIPRTLLMLPTWMYARGTDGIYVNLFIGSAVTVEGVAGTDVEVVQATEYPWDSKVFITVNPKASAKFAIMIRTPARDVSGLYFSRPVADGIRTITVNGAPIKPAVVNNYLVISREWKAGDRIDLELPVVVQRVKADQKIESDRGKVALRYGPLMYNIEEEDQDITQALAVGTPLTTEWREDFLGGVQVIKGKFATGAPLLAIPNYVRYNRRPGLPRPPAPPAPPAPGVRPPPRLPTSIVWIREA